MRIVRKATEFRKPLRLPGRSRARLRGRRSAGGKYIEGARHVEIQILGDHHGNVMHLFERDCSVRGDIKKVIEESPSPAVTPEIHSRMTDAAVALAARSATQMPARWSS